MARPETTRAASESTDQSESHCARAWSDYETTFDRLLTERPVPIHEADFELAADRFGSAPLAQPSAST